MKKSVLFILLGLLLVNSVYAQKYFGKSFPETKNVDEYFDKEDVEKTYSVMGKAELDQGFRSLEKCQKKIMDLAKKKGADGVIFFLDEDVYGTSTSSGANINEKKKDKTTVTGSSSTVEMKKKIIKATFIKYD